MAAVAPNLAEAEFMGIWSSAGGSVQLTGGDPWWATTPKALWPQGLQAEFAASSLWSDDRTVSAALKELVFLRTSVVNACPT